MVLMYNVDLKQIVRSKLYIYKMKHISILKYIFMWLDRSQNGMTKFIKTEFSP